MPRPRTTRSGAEAPLVVYGANAVLELLRSGEPVDRLCLGRGPRTAELSAAALARGVRVETADHPALDRLAGPANPQGAGGVRRPPVRAPGGPGPQPGARDGGPQGRGLLAGRALAPGRDAARTPGTSCAPGTGGGRGGWGAPAARPANLRLHGLHPHGPGCRVAQRRGGGRDRPLRADPPPVEFITPFAEI